MHIAINGWFYDQPNTGSGQYVRELTRALARVGKENTYTLVLPPHIDTVEDLPEAVNVIQTHGGPGGKLGKVWFEQRLFSAAVAQAAAEVAHVPYWGPPFQSPAKLVTSVLDVVPLMFPEYNAGFGNKLYTSLVTAAVDGSAHVITLSEAAKADVVAYLKVPPEKVTPTHLAPKDVFHPRMGAEGDDAVRVKYDLPEQFVLYLGGFDARKRVAQLIAAYAYIARVNGTEVPLVLAGQEPEWREPLFPNMREMIAANEIDEEAVMWLGYIDEADKPALYRLASVFVFPTAYEGFGLPVIEAMASGTPVVANEIPVLEEIVGDGAFLVEDGNATRMAGAIIALLEQEPLYATMVNQGLAASSNFTWRKTAQQTLDIYERARHYTD